LDEDVLMIQVLGIEKHAVPSVSVTSGRGADEKWLFVFLGATASLGDRVWEDTYAAYE
jgi:hypothetical protein